MNSSGRILLVDDSTVMRAMVRRILEEAHYEVIEAANGQQAYDMCLQIQPDVALLNVEMPVLNGRELLKLLKSTPELAEIPVIFLTGRTSTEEIVEGLRLGAHDYLRKPFEPPELIARVSAAIRVARLQQQLGQRNRELDLLSRTDQLTGLSNRRHGEERLTSELANARRYEKSIALLMVDVDHFKAINDRYGHAGGDDVLRELARRLKAVLRSGDTAARWGGEEFLVILSETKLDGAMTLAERFREAMRSEEIALAGGSSCRVTVSIGVAIHHENDRDDLVREADEALYRAKNEGRDRVCLFSS